MNALHRLSSAAWLCTITLLASGCSDARVEPLAAAPTSQDPWPIAAGQEWTYLVGLRVCGIMQPGWLGERVGEPKRESVWPISATFDLPGASAHAIPEHGSGAWHVARQVDGLYELADASGNTKMKMIPLPASDGLEWHEAFSTGTVHGRIVGREAVSTPAGVFQNCWKVEISVELPGKAPALFGQCWFAPGVGRVRLLDFRPESGELWRERILVSRDRAPSTAEAQAAIEWFQGRIAGL